MAFQSHKAHHFSMIAKSNTDISEILSAFRTRSLKVSFLVPTETGLKKSIMDATGRFRDFLFDAGIHDFNSQSQGPENKKIVDTILISQDKHVPTKTSLYRPHTKHGDPRVWVYQLVAHASEGDLLAFLSTRELLVVINCSNCDMQGLLESINSKIPNILSVKSSSISDELLHKLRQISSKGFIKSLRPGDTGVGFTLETHLGIAANSSKAPDFKGIELKSVRQRSPRGTFFSMAPDWSKSNLSAKQLIERRGYYSPRFGPLKTLHQTLTTKNNARNLRLELKQKDIYGGCEENNTFIRDVYWSLEEFEKRLTDKHRETFWIDVETKGSGSFEEFKYRAVTHTSGVDLGAIPVLFEEGVITLDYILWEKGENWQNYTKKSGYDYLWKIKKKSLNALFEFVTPYDL